MAMDGDSQELTPLEKGYFEWFEQTSKQVPSVFQSLSAEDKTVFNQRLKFGEHPEEVTRSRTNYVRALYAYALQDGKPIACDEATLTTVVLKVTRKLHAQVLAKPTDLLSARIYVYNQLLTQQERATWTEANYVENPQAAHRVVVRFSNLLVEELARLGLVESTDEAKKQKAKELYHSKVAELKKAYDKPEDELLRRSSDVKE
jgi:hypothetical protein